LDILLETVLGEEVSGEEVVAKSGDGFLGGNVSPATAAGPPLLTPP